MNISSVSEWHGWFKEGSVNVEDDERSSRSRSHKIEENVEKVRNVVHSDRR
jgi:hypothetical protein